ncbi:RagB/SusD family nutrient uptake outer membrane protein [Lutimonas vermicola]|uniref:RagB/SusD family nutrient uptake outer membrane protein n=1 Tax=Lutimonas vermicola TaxID=414288 RepID=A0ABU9L0Z4_9FLAO
MKNKIIYLFIMLVGVLACSDDFSEVPAYGALSDEALQNAQGVDLLLIGAYSLLDGNSNTGGSDYARAADGWWTDVMSDDAHKGSTNSDQPDLYAFEVMNWQTSNGYIDARWVGLFAGVNRANAVIDLIGKLDPSEGDFSAQLAQARFLRGHFNFELQVMWGNVPYISDVNFADVEFNQPNPGPIWDKIIDDMSYAETNLPETQDEVGRPTSWAAKAYLGKVYLHKGDTGPALAKLTEVINGNHRFGLLTEYADNFRLAGDNSDESLLAIQFTADDGLSFNGNIGGTLNFPGPINCCGFYNPTQDLLNAFQTDANGLPLLDTYNQTDVTSDYGINSDEPFTPFAGNLDPRADYTVGRRGIEFNGYGVHPGKDWQRANFSDLSGPYTPKKNVYQASETANQGAGGWGEQRSGVNYHIIRFADVLLMGAEAAAEENQLELATDWVNEVRRRAKNSTYVSNDGTNPAANYKIEEYPATFPNQEYAIKAVRFERRLELGMEGKRLFDIRRWGATDIMNAYFVNEGRTITSFAGLPAPYDPHFDLSPIPLRAIDLSGGILTQNPGY